MVITGGVCLWATASAPAADRALVATCAGAAALVLCAALTLATYGMQT